MSEAFSEEFNSDSSFHKQIQDILKADGSLVCIAWTPYSKDRLWVGLAIMSRGEELITRRFSVLPGKTKYGLRIMRQALTIQSDYFEDVA